ncbi:MAG: hypothetical protein WC780_02805 [Lentimicrobiaceae bacterium]|jgi:hypothetical protein
MKAISIILGLVIGISAVTIAQEADSIVVIYDSQHTIFPIPAFGRQTTVKMADSIQIIEFGVSRRKTNDSSWQQPYSSNIHNGEKSETKTKWFSQIEAGYTLDYVPDQYDYMYYYIIPLYSSMQININDINTDNISGYKLGLSINEREKYINSRFSFVSGFKLGFAQSIRLKKSEPIAQDTLDHVYIWYNAMTLSHIQILFPFGFSYHFSASTTRGQINLGANVGTSIEYQVDKYSYSRITTYVGSPLLFQPYLGIEFGKIGLQFLSGLTFYPNTLMTPDNTPLQEYVRAKVSLGLSLTYRFY